MDGWIHDARALTKPQTLDRCLYPAASERATDATRRCHFSSSLGPRNLWVELSMVPPTSARKRNAIHNETLTRNAKTPEIQPDTSESKKTLTAYGPSSKFQKKRKETAFSRSRAILPSSIIPFPYRKASLRCRRRVCSVRMVLRHRNFPCCPRRPWQRRYRACHWGTSRHSRPHLDWRIRKR